MITLRAHLAAIQVLRDELAVERDRRYAEVSIEREKALKIKEVADLAALQLAREIQTYKDEKANELREQINRERGHYASKDDLANVGDKLEAMIKPLITWQAANQGGSSRVAQLVSFGITIAAVVVAVIALVTR